MAISFNGIGNNVRVPLTHIEFDSSGAVRGTPVMEWRVLLLGHPETGNTGDTLKPVLITSADQAAGLWGRGSQIASMARMALRNGNMLEMYCMAVPPDAAAVAAKGAVTFTGQCTVTGVVSLYIGGTRVRAKAVAGETLATTATRLAAAINADSTLPVTAVASADNAGLINLTCRWAGATGNALDVRLNYASEDVLPTGLRASITAVSGGAADPDMDQVITALGDTWWKALVTPWVQKTEREQLEEWLDAQFGPMRQQECQAWGAYRGTLAETSTYGNGGNSQLVSVMGVGKLPSSPWDFAAAYGMRAAVSLATDPARPLQTLELTGIKAPAREDRWSLEERNILLWDGIATYRVTEDGTVQIEREVTMYQQNSYGMADPSYLDVQTVATLGYWRYAVNSRITQKFPRHKLADDGTQYGDGQAIVTPSVIRAELLALFRELEAKGLVENADAFKEGLLVERNADDRNRLDVLAAPDLVNQFRILGMLTRFVL